VKTTGLGFLSAFADFSCAAKAFAVEDSTLAHPLGRGVAASSKN